MAKGFKQGPSGGANLNFKVVGNPQPENPKEKTIWVDTDEKITAWHFIATEPAEPAEGMVWIRTASYSNAEFNALKKNGIQVYPISAKQYTGGAWVDKTAKSYLGGAWCDWWDGSLFDSGNHYMEITGGWTATLSETSSDADLEECYFRVEDGQLVVYCTEWVEAIVYHDTYIDLANYDTVTATITHYSAAYRGRHYLEVEDESGAVVATMQITGTGTHNLNIATLTGKHRIHFFTDSNNSVCELSVRSVKLS